MHFVHAQRKKTIRLEKKTGQSKNEKDRRRRITLHPSPKQLNDGFNHDKFVKHVCVCVCLVITQVQLICNDNNPAMWSWFYKNTTTNTLYKSRTMYWRKRTHSFTHVQSNEPNAVRRRAANVLPVEDTRENSHRTLVGGSSLLFCTCNNSSSSTLSSFLCLLSTFLSSVFRAT